MADQKISALSSGALASTGLFAAVINSTTMKVTAQDIVNIGAPSATGYISSGALYYGNASGELTELAAGASGQFLGLSTGVPSWVTATGVLPSTAGVSSGAILYISSGGVPAWLAVGTTGQALKVSATAGNLEWGAVAGGGGSTALMLMAREAHLPSGASSNAAATVQIKTSGVASDPKPRFHEILFATATIQHIQWSFMCPSQFVSTPKVNVYYKMASATAGTVEFGAYLAAVTDGDAQDVDAKGFDTVNWASTTVPGTSGYMDVLEITMTNNDSITANDFVVLDVCRNGPGSTDTATGNAEVVAVQLIYT